MSRPVVVNVPHNLSRAEAKSRLASGFARISENIGAKMTSLEEAWEGDRLTFRAAALGQTIAGRLDVLDDVVRIELELPGFLGALADKLGGRLKSETRLLLEKK